MSVLNLTLDASQIPATDRSRQSLKVIAHQPANVKSQVISIEGDHVDIAIEVDRKQTTWIAIGPATASDEDMFQLRTLTITLAPDRWAGQSSLTPAPLVLTPERWLEWLEWRRALVLTGRVLDSNGSPVPDAEVRAYDVDYFWWWSSKLQIGTSATTDAAGCFTIPLRWCCGWRAWWWWEMRQWRVEPLLVEKIKPILRRNPALHLPEPGTAPPLDFVGLPSPNPPMGNRSSLTRLDPSVMGPLRDNLLGVLPRVPEFERLRIWPWCSWTPWLDRSPHVIFEVTRSATRALLLGETIFDTRREVQNRLDVLLQPASRRLAAGG